MATSNDTFPADLAFVLHVEGGYSNDPNDPGGATNKGILQTEYNAFRRAAGKFPQSVRFITTDEAAAIYRNEYYDKGRAGLPAPSQVADPALRLVLFDTAVNPRKGVWEKIKGILAGNNDPRAAVEQILSAREGLYIQRGQEKPSQQVYVAGWLDRIAQLRRETVSRNPALALVRNKAGRLVVAIKPLSTPLSVPTTPHLVATL